MEKQKKQTMVKTGVEKPVNRTSIKSANQLVILAVNNAFEKIAQCKELN